MSKPKACITQLLERICRKCSVRIQKKTQTWRSVESKTGTSRCPKCDNLFEVRGSTLTITCPSEYKILGFRAVISVPCTGPGCKAMHWMVLEAVRRGAQRLFREAWEVAIETQDLVPYDSELRK